MKNLLFAFCLAGFFTAVNAQEETGYLTVYKSYKPASIHMVSGKTIKNPLTNVFLKNGKLLYLQGDKTMEAFMDNIVSVDIDSAHYVNINKQLALEVDSVKENVLYCVTLIDVDSYNRMLRNNVNISNLSLGDQISYSTIDLTPTDGMQLPVIHNFYYLYNHKIIRVHERDITRVLPKSKKHAYKSILALDDFSWTSAKSLMQLLRAITE